MPSTSWAVEGPPGTLTASASLWPIVPGPDDESNWVAGAEPLNEASAIAKVEVQNGVTQLVVYELRILHVVERPNTYFSAALWRLGQAARERDLRFLASSACAEQEPRFFAQLVQLGGAIPQIDGSYDLDCLKESSY